jgi:sugar fermentation stimulation protein A
MSTTLEENRVTKGSYVLLLRLAHGRSIPVGRLRDTYFPAGHYAYVGSAMRGLIPRIKRHLVKDKKARWHIDYLRREAAVSGVIVCESEARTECTIARGLTLRLREIPGFGASDCKCPSHLFFATDERQIRTFVLTTLNVLPVNKRVVHLNSRE